MGSAYSKRKLVLVHPLVPGGLVGGLQDDDDDTGDDPMAAMAGAITISPSVQSRFIIVSDDEEAQLLKTESWARRSPHAQQQPPELFSPPAATVARPRSTNRVSPFGSQSDEPGAPGAPGARPADQGAQEHEARATTQVANSEVDQALPLPIDTIARRRVPVDRPRGQGDDGLQHTTPAPNKPADLNALLFGLGEHAVVGALPGMPHVPTEADATAQMREHLKLAAELREQLQADGRRRERLQAGRGALQRCYAAHPGDPLACGDLVRAFAATVDASLRPHPARAPLRTATHY
ncbi:uncharacterized protein LOC127752350 [Frankliniella occidentalis]|uniref:Uncharacterized protein LOC127752350 n=1 Tax=Frankliniella occidentalis TaxID=133901 RepID=A0A9C6XWB4_FRAOC|nr:uncharacterized protein LOC127752350 [Frankliniella occidentalis]